MGKINKVTSVKDIATCRRFKMTLTLTDIKQNAIKQISFKVSDFYSFIFSAGRAYAKKIRKAIFRDESSKLNRNSKVYLK